LRVLRIRDYNHLPLGKIGGYILGGQFANIPLNIRFGDWTSSVFVGIEQDVIIDVESTLRRKQGIVMIYKFLYDPITYLLSFTHA